jgi:hypothetical protein
MNSHQAGDSIRSALHPAFPVDHHVVVVDARVTATLQAIQR